MISRNASTAALIIVMSCAPPAPVLQPINQIPLEAMEAAFRTLFTDNPSGVEASTYCLAVVRVSPSGHPQYSDPPSDVMQELAVAQQGLHPYSQCRFRQDRPIGRLLDDVTGKQAMILSLLEPTRRSGDTLVFWGGYSCGGLCGGAGPLRVWQRGSAWQTLFKVEVVS